MAISIDPKPTIYRNSYENMPPDWLRWQRRQIKCLKSGSIGPGYAITSGKTDNIVNIGVICIHEQVK